MTTPSSGGNAAPKASPLRRTVLYLGGKSKSLVMFGGKVAALAAAVSLAWHTYERHTVNSFFGENLTDAEDEDGKKSKKPMKRVLVLPFDNLKLVEERKSGGFDARSLLQQRGKQPTIVLETKELVDIIHKAASDPNITALYADFGEGMRYVSEFDLVQFICARMLFAELTLCLYFILLQMSSHWNMHTLKKYEMQFGFSTNPIVYTEVQM